MKNKILLLCPVYYPYPAGGAQSFPIIAKVLSTEFQVIVLTEYHSKKSFFEKGENINIFRILPVRDNFGKKNFFYSFLSYLLTYLIIYLFVFCNILFGLRNLHFTRYIGTIMIPLLAILRLLNCKIVYDCRTGNNEERLKRYFSKIFKFCTLALANSQSAFSVLNTNANKNLPKYLFDNPLILPKPIFKREMFINNQKLLRKKYICCLGTISLRKSSLMILRAYLLSIKKLENNNYPNIIPSLVFAGRNDIGEDFDKYICDYSEIIYLGEISHKESLLLSANAYGSINASSCEGIPRSSLEALSFETPSILSGAVPEFFEFCNESCFELGNKANEKELSKLINKLIMYPETFISSNKKYPLYKHNYESFKKRLLDLYAN